MSSSDKTNQELERVKTGLIPGLRDEHLEEAEFIDFSHNLLDPEARDAAIRHLDSCARCREVLAELHRADDGSGSTKLADPLLGQMLGEYRVDQALSRGGMGVVYRGVQPTIGKKVAIKVLLPDAAEDPDQMHRLLEEARAVNAIHHPNIIDIFSFGDLPDGRHYFIMELLDGLPLNELQREKGRLTPGEVMTVLEQSMSALGAAHAAGVEHRDLKPANLFVSTLPDQHWHVTVLDFGLAKRLGASSSTSPNLVMGTPGFMSPEQIRGQKVGPPTDLYAMGVVAWVLLTGDEPFHADSFVDLMIQHLEQPLPSLRQKAPECPEPLVSLIERLLAKRVDERPPSALAVLEELKRIRKALLGRDTLKAPGPVVAATRATPAARPADAQPTRLIKASAMSREKNVAVADQPKPSSNRGLIIATMVLAAVTLAGLLVLLGVGPPRTTQQPPAPEAPKQVEVEAPPVAPKVAEPPPVEVKNDPPPVAPVAPVVPKEKEQLKPKTHSPAPPNVEKRIAQGREKAESLASAPARRMMRLELDGLSQRLTKGESPKQINSELDELLQRYGVP